MATLQSVLSANYGSNEDGGLWVADPSSCWTDTAGTAPASADDLVARIDDLSDNGRHATQGTAANQMRLKQEVGGRWYLDPEDRDVWYEIDTWATNANWTVAAAYRVHTVTATQTVAYGRSTTSGNWQYRAAGLTANPSRLFLRVESSSNDCEFESTTANAEVQNLDVCASGVSTDRTTWANALHRFHNHRTGNYFTGSINASVGTPNQTPDVSVLFRASSTYNRSQVYGVALCSASTTQESMDNLLAFLADPSIDAANLGFRITDIKEPNESDQLVTSVANATVYVWIDGTDDGAPTWTFTNQSITAGALEDITLAGIDPEESSVVVTVHWDAGAGETKFFRYVPSVIDLDAV